ncbi:hypothetical protein BLOT_012529 [Blomia tropicalis]|nr:hypothetical protein BLOT_012529 [Blomia tropicalis]
MVKTGVSPDSIGIGQVDKSIISEQLIKSTGINLATSAIEYIVTILVDDISNHTLVKEKSEKSTKTFVDHFHCDQSKKFSRFYIGCI